jgi:hypothetical protein
MNIIFITKDIKSNIDIRLFLFKYYTICLSNFKCVSSHWIILHVIIIFFLYKYSLFLNESSSTLSNSSSLTQDWVF